MNPPVDLGALLVVLEYAQAVQDNVAVQLESTLGEQARALLVQLELTASLN
ncbi:MAG: hypothetical protein KIT58_01220 [Planctomycetota bacterium]|nr:hypothetical protein [Planctomycetota bacterium]